MGQTATVSTAIIDSTAIGRDVLTAADLAAAQTVLGIVPFDVTADYNFTGDITSSGDNKHYFIGQAGDANTAYLTTQYDGVNGQLASLATGSQSRRPLYVGGVSNGTDSGILVGGSSAGYLRTGSNTTAAWSATALVSYVDFRPQTDGNIECGRDGNRWESVYSVDADFSGSVTTGGLTTGIQTVTAASDTLVDTDHTTLCDCTSNAITINLPTAVAGLRYEIKKIDSSSNAVTIDGFGSETIDGGLTAVINTQYESVTIVSDGTNWFIV